MTQKNAAPPVNPENVNGDPYGGVSDEYRIDRKGLPISVATKKSINANLVALGRKPKYSEDELKE